MKEATVEIISVFSVIRALAAAAERSLVANTSLTESFYVSVLT